METSASRLFQYVIEMSVGGIVRFVKRRLVIISSIGLFWKIIGPEIVCFPLELFLFNILNLLNMSAHDDFVWSEKSGIALRKVLKCIDLSCESINVRNNFELNLQETMIRNPVD